MLKFAGVCAQKQVLVQANTSLREVLIQLSQHLNEGGVHTGKHLFEGGVNTDCLNTVSTLIRGPWSRNTNLDVRYESNVSELEADT